MDGSPYDRPLGHRLGKRKRGSSPADGEEVVAQRHQTRTPFPSTYSQHATGSLPFQRASGSPDHRRPACRQEFEIAIICALPLEYDAVCLLFDEFWDDHVEVYGRATGDRNTYTNGRIGKHNVVLVLLYRMGKATAAGAAASMCLSYTGLRVVFLVGICGGVPFPRDGEEIVLGDVVISKTIIQYDFGRQYPGHFARKEAVGDTLGMPSKDVRNMLALLETRRGRGRLRTKTAEYLQELQANAKGQTIGNTYAYPGVVEDKLFDADYRHKHRGYPQCICHENHGQFGSVYDEVTLSSIREELEWVPMPAPARGSREDYEGPANSSWADRMIFSPDTSFGEGLRVNFGDLDRSLDEANAQLRSLLEMTRPINPRAPLTRESSSSTLRPHGFADDSRLSDSTLRPFSQSLETPPSFNTWNDFLTGQGHGTAPRTAMYIPGLTEVNFVPPPLPPPRQLPFTRLSTETDNAQLDRQAVIHDKATDHDENYHPASGSPVRGGTAYHASSMANEMLKGEIEDGAGEALWLQHGRFFPSTADAHTRHTLERLNSNQEEVQAVEGIRRLG
ncbi:phosphorylase superfamily protein [Purpureocillium lilacinum]|uniref:Phosphorylase superfamily protein n=1 Tax=Purpureocillium lilacinum TaxID=33203 RepID=A0A179HNY5_PURLI|nr:phosphorylase superfamily protein [Purpureocillium lilacinum]OAQ91572.1 phosphorylase superfamily protein [Purpureocillium lilacinum]